MARFSVLRGIPHACCQSALLEENFEACTVSKYLHSAAIMASDLAQKGMPSLEFSAIQAVLYQNSFSLLIPERETAEEVHTISAPVAR